MMLQFESHAAVPAARFKQQFVLVDHKFTFVMLIPSITCVMYPHPYDCIQCCSRLTLQAVIESGVLDIENRKEVKLYYGTRSEGVWGRDATALGQGWARLGRGLAGLQATIGTHTCGMVGPWAGHGDVVSVQESAVTVG